MRLNWLPTSLTVLTFVSGLGTALADVRSPDAIKLVEAIKSADKATVRTLLQKHIDVNLSEPDGTTPLHWAVREDDIETVTLLIRAGANVQAANRYGVTSLPLACTNGNAAMIELLLKAGR
jgi:ankyrin repeat protein